MSDKAIDAPSVADETDNRPLPSIDCWERADTCMNTPECALLSPELAYTVIVHQLAFVLLVRIHNPNQ